MKKLILLSALICANQLYGMEPLEPEHILSGSWHNLPTDVKSLIITAVTQSGDNLDKAIKNIVTFSRVNTELNKMINLNDLQGFTKIMHMLADKFFDKSPYSIAKKFKTPTATEYFNLSDQLNKAVYTVNSDEVEKLIQEGADINSVRFGGYGAYSLYLALKGGRSRDLKKLYDTIKLLLTYGADPYGINLAGKKLLEVIDEWYRIPKINERLKALFEEAMKKYPPSH